ncbi:MAG: iron transporter [Lachnospiraceae bacterium]|nr:iron transporter [Lachnospiraceae bacterium]
MKMKKLVALLSAATVASMALAGCGGSASSSSAPSQAVASAAKTEAASTEAKVEAASTAAKTEAASAAGSEAVTAETTADAAADAGAGFTEYPIFEDEEVGFLNVSAVYFQPVPMSNGNEKTDGFDIHLECDVSALQNDLGFGTGDWVPYMTVDYIVTGSDGKVAAEGTFMEMNASDGPHYGANIALPNADTYSLKFVFHSPEENGYLIHTDAETGPGGTFDEFFKDGNLEVTYDGWDYTPQEW